jgi:hypothetical protein
MTELGGRQWAQVRAALSAALVAAIPAEVRGEQHLAVEAVVAYVDGELTVAAHHRATRHLARCTLCTAEVAAQRQARAAVRGADSPAMPASLLAALHAIPQSAELPPGPQALSVTPDGEFVVAQRPVAVAAAFGQSAPLGSAARLGSGRRLGTSGLGDAGLGSARPEPGAEGRTGDQPPAEQGSGATGRGTRRVVQGAGVVVSSLVLGALALAALSDPDQRPGADRGTAPVSVVPANFQFQPGSGLRAVQPDRPPTDLGRPQR